MPCAIHWPKDHKWMCFRWCPDSVAAEESSVAHPHNATMLPRTNRVGYTTQTDELTTLLFFQLTVERIDFEVPAKITLGRF